MSDAAQEQATHCEVDHAFGDVNAPFVVAHEASPAGQPAEGSLDDPALAQAVLREDADFHTYQMLEAAVRQAQEWTSMRERRHILVAAARYVAAHSPTERARLQTAMVARRLSRGLSVHESIPDPDH